MTALMSGERQVAVKREGIRKDHTSRYDWAADRLKGMEVVDAACGVGYGSEIMADAGCMVRGFDSSTEAIEFAKEHFNHNPNITYHEGDLETQRFPVGADAVVCFEALEHTTQPGKVLTNFAGMAKRLLVSVPNEDVFPYHPQEAVFHARHYRKHELERLLADNRWQVTEWWGQEGPESEPVKDLNGRTLIAVCELAEGPVELKEDVVGSVAGVVVPEPGGPERFALPGRPLPESVAIVAMGTSAQSYMRASFQNGTCARLADEIWCINAGGGTFQHDRLFHMDDLMVQKSRAERSPKSGVGGMMEWMADHPGPVYTSKAYPEYPGAVEYPLEWVINQTGHCYFNNTVPYAFAMALAMGVKTIKLFGCDYSYTAPGEQGKREAGRACLEYWVGVAAEKKVSVHITDDTQLLDANRKKAGQNFYGYDAEWITVELTPEGQFSIQRVDRRPEDIPTAVQMDARYSHDERIEAMESKL